MTHTSSDTEKDEKKDVSAMFDNHKILLFWRRMDGLAAWFVHVISTYYSRKGSWSFYLTHKFTRSENPIIWKRRLTEIKKERTQTLKTNWRLLISCLDYLSCPFCHWYLNRNGKNKLYEDRTYCLVLYGGTYTYLRAQINTSYYRGHLTHRTHSSHKCSSRHFTFHRKYVFFE